MSIFTFYRRNGLEQERYKAVYPKPKFFQSLYTAAELISATEKLENDKWITFYVKCESYPRASDRLHFQASSPGKIVIDIDKGFDGGTWSKECDIAILNSFFENIYSYIATPKSYGFTYKQW